MSFISNRFLSRFARNKEAQSPFVQYEDRYPLMSAHNWLQHQAVPLATWTEVFVAMDKLVQRSHYNGDIVDSIYTNLDDWSYHQLSQNSECDLASLQGLIEQLNSNQLSDLLREVDNDNEDEDHGLDNGKHIDANLDNTRPTNLARQESNSISDNEEDVQTTRNRPSQKRRNAAATTVRSTRQRMVASNQEREATERPAESGNREISRIDTIRNEPPSTLVDRTQLLRLDSQKIARDAQSELFEVHFRPKEVFFVLYDQKFGDLEKKGARILECCPRATELGFKPGDIICFQKEINRKDHHDVYAMTCEFFRPLKRREQLSLRIFRSLANNTSGAPVEETVNQAQLEGREV